MRCTLLSRGLWFGFLLTAVTIPGLGVPSAIARQDPQASALSQLSDIFKPKRRSGGTRGGVCLITPGYRTSTVWSDRPLFAWKTTGNTPVGRIEIRTADTNTVVWNQDISPAANQITYQGGALQPGQTYEVRLYDATGESLIQDADLQPRFTLMDNSQRQQIQQDLASNTKQLELQSQDIIEAERNSEEIAVETATYFTQQDLWSDALQTLYAIPNPSPEMQQLIQTAATEACG